jgi:hypothetical protein
MRADSTSQPSTPKFGYLKNSAPQVERFSLSAVSRSMKKLNLLRDLRALSAADGNLFLN